MDNIKPISISRRLHAQTEPPGEVERFALNKTNPMGQLKEYLDPKVLQDEDFQMNRGLVQQLKLNSQLRDNS